MQIEIFFKNRKMIKNLKTVSTAVC